MSGRGQRIFEEKIPRTMDIRMEDAAEVDIRVDDTADDGYSNGRCRGGGYSFGRCRGLWLVVLALGFVVEGT